MKERVLKEEVLKEELFQLEESAKYAEIVGNQEGINAIQKKFTVKSKERELDAHIDANEQKVEELKNEIQLMKRSYNLDFQKLVSRQLDLKSYEEALELLKKLKVELF